MKTQIVEYSVTAAALADLSDIYHGVVYDVTTLKGMQDAKEGRAELRTYRTDLEKMRVAIKSPALERCRLIDAEAKDITAKLLALESPIDAQIKLEENKEKEAAMAKAIAERHAAEAVIAKEMAERIAAERAEREAEHAKIAADRAEIARQQTELAERELRVKILEQIKADNKANEANRFTVGSRLSKGDQASYGQFLRLEIENREAAHKSALQGEVIYELSAQNTKELNILLDGRLLLTEFLADFNEVQEFQPICSAINMYFNSIKA